MELFQHITPFFASAGLFMSSFLGHHHMTSVSASAKPNVVIQKANTDTFYKASRSVTYQGYSVSMDVAVPKNGGNITGKISGDCNGVIKGHYDGQDNGVIQGNINGACDVMFLKMPGNATFAGTLNKTTNTAQLNISVKVDTFEKTEPVTISFN
ncbi:MAG: hypothetical protein ACREHC_06660 [Candidatus Levyibacteriota bacterium]